MTIPKFRVWDEVSCTMITTKDYEDLSDLFCCLNADDGFFSELMQSTGLIDKNGEEVFEGDVVKLCFEEDGLFEIYLDTVGDFTQRVCVQEKYNFLNFLALTS